MGANGNLRSLEGKNFGNLLVLGRAGRAKGRVLWRCRCSCGAEVDVPAPRLYQGRQKSCGQAHRYRQPFNELVRMEQSCWRAMLERCYNEKNPAFKNYGGRGIRVHSKWRKDFQQFVADIGPRPSDKHSLDRYPDNNGDYEPSNVRWATAKQQARNTRVTVRVMIDGVSVPLIDYANKVGVNNQMLKRRLKRGWKLEDALTMPAGARSNRDPWPQEWLDYFKEKK